ncbi:centrosomal protein POC5-like [Mizuhopecten yessoensis]|uniref:Centrosomal protein POC5 n=1 Tax=Mizuhopecten yessoensis TaxID=6573 RepID=A0A210QMM1_MIZYE|nr:centrosomal protein POC5-like [Mizuhopecten yessoensis]OWF49978.1 Centrosomal protein POC5 [Mizuhopecten yessoensis]
MSSHGSLSLPDAPPDSPGSSVSTRLMEEYEELLKYAVVVPSYDPNKASHTLIDHRDSFPQPETLVTITKQKTASPSEVEAGEMAGSDEESEASLIVKVTRETGLPDFGQSPIQRRLDLRDSDSAHTQEEELEKIPGRLLREINISGGGMEEENIYTSTVDPDVNKMENLMDQWCLDLKRNVLAEYGQSKIRIVEMGRQQLLRAQEKHVSEMTALQNEVESMKELLHTYEQSISRKDQVISNMTHALQKQRERHDLLKKFGEWKIKHNDLKREKFAGQLAAKHYERKMTRTVWDAWHSVIESKWRNRVERACQGKAQEVCMSLTNNYETKIASLNEALEASRMEVAKLHTERDQYEEGMKKAFMRGVCALNLEAMTMFQSGEGPQPGAENHAYSDNLESGIPEKDMSAPKTIPQEPVYQSQPRPQQPAAKVITSQAARSATLSSMAQSKQAASGKVSSTHKGKVISTRMTGKVDSGRPGLGGPSTGPTLAPPMSSVIVERHQSVNKQTIGQATASRHPAKSPIALSEYQQSGILHRRLAGQTGSLSISPHIQTVKVVD